MGRINYTDSLDRGFLSVSIARFASSLSPFTQRFSSLRTLSGPRIMYHLASLYKYLVSLMLCLCDIRCNCSTKQQFEGAPRNDSADQVTSVGHCSGSGGAERSLACRRRHSTATASLPASSLMAVSLHSGAAVVLTRVACSLA